MRTHRARWLPLVLALAMAIVGCGDDDLVDRAISIGGVPTAVPTVAAVGAVKLIYGTRHFALVTEPLGAEVLAQPEAGRTKLGRFSFGTVLSVVAETQIGKQRWRQVEDGGWVATGQIRLFPDARTAGEAAVEMRLFAGPTLQSVAPEFTPEPDAPPRLGVSAPPFGVVIAPAGATVLTLPGGGKVGEENLSVGTLLAIYQEAIYRARDTYYRVDGGWVAASTVSTYGTAREALEASWRATVDAISPGGEIQPELRPAVLIIDRVPEFRYLARHLREERIPVYVSRLRDTKAIASYDMQTRVILVGDRWANVDSRALASAIIHEAPHAWEHTRGLTNAPGETCYQAELRAFHNQTRLWERFFGTKGKPDPQNEAEMELNAVLAAFRSDPETIKRAIADRYHDQCERRPAPRPAGR